MDHKIHIAYGFHVNCYHSYRGDTDDAAGFGSFDELLERDGLFASFVKRQVA